MCQGRATHVPALWCCMWGRGLRGNNATCSALWWLSVTSTATRKEIGPFWCWFPGGWACVHCRSLWVSLTNSPVRLEVSPTASTPTGFSVRSFETLFPHTRTLHGLHGLSHSPVVPSGLSTCGTASFTSHCLAQSASHHLTCSGPSVAALSQSFALWLPASAPTTGLDECFFFNSLAVRLPYSLIFCQFWGALFLNLLLSFF